MAQNPRRTQYFYLSLLNCFQLVIFLTKEICCYCNTIHIQFIYTLLLFSVPLSTFVLVLVSFRFVSDLSCFCLRSFLPNSPGISVRRLHGGVLQRRGSAALQLARFGSRHTAVVPESATRCRQQNVSLLKNLRDSILSDTKIISQLTNALILNNYNAKCLPHCIRHRTLESIIQFLTGHLCIHQENCYKL